MVTSDITDGFKTSLNLNRQEMDDIKVEELGKDGTVERKNPQKSLENFFQKKPDFVKRTKSKGPEIQEQIEEDSENQKEQE